MSFTFKAALCGAALAATVSMSPAAFADVSGKLVLYTSQPNADAQQTVDAFTAKHPGVEVEWVRDGTTKVMAKLRAEFEAGSTQARRAADRRHGHDGRPEAGRPPDGP
jgi:iron(III) transport system substrate-binding protein